MEVRLRLLVQHLRRPLRRLRRLSINLNQDVKILPVLALSSLDRTLTTFVVENELVVKTAQRTMTIPQTAPLSNVMLEEPVVVVDLRTLKTIMTKANERHHLEENSSLFRNTICSHT